MFDFFGSMPTEDRLIFELSKLYEQYTPRFHESKGFSSKTECNIFTEIFG